MSKMLARCLFVLLALTLGRTAFAADSTVTALGAASALSGTELLYCTQGGADKKCTIAQVVASVGTIGFSPSFAGAGVYTNVYCVTPPVGINALQGCWSYNTTATDTGQLQWVTSSTSNVMSLVNTNISGYSALTFRGKSTLRADATVVEEQGAIGWIPGLPGMILEASHYDGTQDPLYPPNPLMIFQSGGVDATGGLTVTCAINSGSTSITCTGSGGANGTLITGTGIPPHTTVSSGGGTVNIVASAAATDTNASVSLNFSTPVWGQRHVLEFTSTGSVYFRNWANGSLLVLDRINSRVGINRAVPTAPLDVAGQVLAGSFQATATGTLTNPIYVFTVCGTNCGWYAPAAGQLEVSVLGANVLDYGVTTASVWTAPSLNLTANGALSLTSNGARLAFRSGSTTTITSPAAATIQIGLGDAASPAAQSLYVQSVVAGTTNGNGANFTIRGSLSTGSGTSGDIIFTTGGTGAGSTAQNSAVQALVIKGATQLINLPAVTTGTPAASLCIDASNNIIKKTTTGACI